ncbi:Uncharacterized protein AXF42_Ash000099 [Apostasia shenzhenica]|uniref:Remorin C-terminal domain-containing protein n=1 Tax=Apostasia shenzhenica TaxID=1088818 RepID=A0A2I0AFJ4_9ASPA|nr:Uncharacterized protein AXF42_Ash000099 [Apostasia shenzhenica]
MSGEQRPTAAGAAGGGVGDENNITEIRDIHALSSPQPPAARGRAIWAEAGSHRSSNLSVGSEVENFTTMSREFNAMVIAGTNLQGDVGAGDGASSLGRIGEDERELEENNPLAIVPDNNPPFPSPRRPPAAGSTSSAGVGEDLSVHRVKKNEVDAKISAWQAAETAKINNRFKREDVTINGWESEQVEKATAWLKKIERKLEEKRARATEKTQNEVAKARRKAEERRASAEAKRGVKVARVLEVANLLRAVGRTPSKRSLF